jgi:hypothetical protein
MNKPLLSICVLLFSVSLFAQSTKEKTKPTPPWWADRFKVSAGLFVPINNTVIEVGNESGSFGTTIDLESDLGFTKSTGTFLGGMEWRASRRSKFALNYYHIDRTSKKTLDKDIEFKDTTYHLGADIKALFNTDIFQFTYGYAFLINPKYELGVSVGAHIVSASIGLGLANGVGSVSGKKDFGFTAPLPDLGIWGGYAINQKWAVNGVFNYLSLTVDNTTGRILSYNAGVTYKILKNLSASLDYIGLNFKVNTTRKEYQGYFKWGYNGPTVTLNYGFGHKPW